MNNLYCSRCGAEVQYAGEWSPHQPTAVKPTCKCWVPPEDRISQLQKELDEANARCRVLYDRLIASEERYSKFIQSQQTQS